MVQTSDIGCGRRVLVGVLACLVLAGGLAAGGSAAPPQVFVSSVDVSDDEPTAGDSIVVTPTVSYSGSEDGSFEVTQVTLEGLDGTRHADESDLGTLGSGDALDVPLGATLESPGETRLVVHVRGVQYGSDGRLDRISHTKRPVFVSVSEPSTPTETTPQLGIEADEMTTGAESTVSVVVSNGGDDELTDLSLELSGLGGTANQTKLDPALGAANSTTITFRVRPAEPGTHPINATLRYDGGHVAASETVDVAPLADDVAVYATLDERNGTDVLRYRLTNHGNAPVRNAVLSGTTADASLPTTALRTVDPGSAETTVVELNDRPTGQATVSAAYETGGTTGETNETVTLGADGTSSGDRGIGGLFDPLVLLSGGVFMTGSTLAYQTLRGRGR
ncbi:CARDB domain-containing protein [Halorubrum laminariae]|uniref:CARDB domain-containing protein n=1 Tax=Halorubrum laminariae TaxID=1433523 RepID=A0ABD6BYS9_9EURY|nr:CARDB domain-containing protein [Halorubrum laminariae]